MPPSLAATDQIPTEPNTIANAIGYAMHRSRSHNAVIRVYDDAGNVIETHEHKGDYVEPYQVYGWL